MEKCKEEFIIDISPNNSCRECNFMCKWMKVRNSYFYNELTALEKYINRIPNSIFKTSINVVYKYNSDAKKLNNSEYKLISRYIKDS